MKHAFANLNIVVRRAVARSIRHVALRHLAANYRSTWGWDSQTCCLIGPVADGRKHMRLARWVADTTYRAATEPTAADRAALMRWLDARA